MRKKERGRAKQTREMVGEKDRRKQRAGEREEEREVGRQIDRERKGSLM